MGSPESFSSSSVATPPLSSMREVFGDGKDRKVSHEEALRQVGEGAQEMKIIRRLAEIDQDMAQIGYILAHPEDADTPWTYYGMLNPASGRYQYSANNPARVVTDPLHHGADSVSVRLFSRSEVEEALATLHKEEEDLKAKIISNQQTGVQERVHEQEVKATEGRKLQDAIAWAKSIRSVHLYELDGRYYASNPTQVIVDAPHSWADSLRVHEITLTNAEKRLDGMELPSTRETWLATLDETIDRLTAKISDHPDEKHPYKDNIRRYLISLRLGTSTLSDPTTHPFVSFPPTTSIRRMARLADTDIEKIEIPEILEATWDMINIARYGASDTLAIAISISRDATSKRLYHLGGEPSEVGQAFDKTLHDNLPDPLAGHLSAFGNSFSAGLAWGIDGSLDYLQAALDTTITPDKLAQNMAELSKTLWNNAPWFCESLGDLLKENIKSPSDLSYVLSYIVAVIACYVFAPAPVSLVAFPAFIANELSPIVQKLHLPKNIVGEITDMAEARLGTKLERKLEAPKESIDKGDTTNTATQRLTNDAESRQIAGTAETLQKITSTAVLANIFGERIMPELASNTPSAMKDTAMDIYLKTILAPKGYENILQLQDAIQSSGNPEVRYNLLRIYERFVKVREVMEKEVMPVWKGYIDFSKQIALKRGNVWKLQSERELFLNSLGGSIGNANPLTQEIVRMYILKDAL